jgi:NAD(P)H-nitrite reductase large subunit
VSAVQGVLLHPQCQIAEITGKDGKATGIIFEDGQTMEADFVIVAMSYRSYGELAEEAGINVTKMVPSLLIIIFAPVSKMCLPLAIVPRQ